MKHVFAALAFLVATPAFAAPDTYWCQGRGRDLSKTLYARILSAEQAREGDKMTWLLVIRDGSETIYSGNVKGSLEDVDLSFKARGLDGMLFLDELNETWVTVDGKEMHFDCDVQPKR